MRFQTSSFLGGITFAAFAALLVAKPADYRTAIRSIHNLLLSADSILFLASACSLGAASCILLWATIGSYAGVQKLALLSPSVIPQLRQGSSAGIPAKDAMLVKDAYDSYHRAGLAIPWAILCIMLSLICIGWQLVWAVGAFMVIVSILAVVFLAPPPFRLNVLLLRKQRVLKSAEPVMDGRDAASQPDLVAEFTTDHS